MYPSPRITLKKIAALTRILTVITVLMIKMAEAVEHQLIKCVALRPVIGVLLKFMGQCLVDLVAIKA
jgi:hypothetical protein